MAWLAGTYSFRTALGPKCFLWKVTEARSPVWKAATECSGHSVDLKIPCSVSGTWSSVSRNTRCAIIRYYSSKTVSIVDYCPELSGRIQLTAFPALKENTQILYTAVQTDRQQAILSI